MRDGGAATPYPGIEPYSIEDAAIFFGRRDEVRSLGRELVIRRAVVLHGPSGVGKSSLVSAGLAAGAESELGLRPTRVRVQPRKGEELVLSPLTAGRASGGELEVLSTAALHERLSRWTESDVRPLLIFDQFEEWVTLTEHCDRDQRESARASQHAVLELLARLIQPSADERALDERALPVKVLVVVRSDYLASLTPLFERCPSLTSSLGALSPIPLSRIPELVRGPFEAFPERFGVELSAALAAEIRTDFEARDQGDGLNLSELQIACASLHAQGVADGHPVAHLPSGGVDAILRDYLESTIASMSQVSRDHAIGLLRRLVTAGGTRAVLPRETLVKEVAAEGAARSEDVAGVLERLERGSKLLRRERRRGVDYYEISSEFLVPWIQKHGAEQELTVQRREMERDRRRTRKFLTAIGVAFVATLGFAKSHWDLGVTTKKTEAQRKEIEAEASTAQALRTAWIRPEESIRAFAEAKSIGGVEALRKDHAAIRRLVMRVRRGQVAFDVDPACPPAAIAVSAGGRIACAAVPGEIHFFAVDPRDVAPKDLRVAGEWTAVALTADARLVVAGDIAGLLLIARTDHAGSTGIPPVVVPTANARIVGIEVSDDERWAVAWDEKGTLHLHAIVDGDPPRLERQELSRLSKVAVRHAVFMPDSSNIAWGGTDRKVHLLSVPGGSSKPIEAGHESSVLEVLPMMIDGRPSMVSREHAGLVRVTEQGDGARAKVQLAGVDDGIRDMAGSSASAHLITGGADGRVRLWNVDPGLDTSVRQREVCVVGEHQGPVNRVFWPRLDPSHAITVGADGHAWVWDLGRILAASDEAYAAAGAETRSVDVAANGLEGVVATVSDRVSTLHFLQRASLRKQWTATDLGHPVSEPVFSWAEATGEIALATADGPALTTFGSTAKPTLVAEEKGVKLVCLSSDGRVLATARRNGGLQVRRRASRDAPWESPSSLPCDKPTCMAMTPDGRGLLTGDEDGEVRGYDLSSDREPWTSRQSSPIRAITIDPWGRLAAIGCEDSTIVLLGTADAWRDRVFRTEDGRIRDVAFAGPEDAMILVAASGMAGVVRVWELSPGRTPLLTLARTDEKRGIFSVAVSSEAQEIYIGTADGRVLELACDACTSAERVPELLDAALQALPSRPASLIASNAKQKP